MADNNVLQFRATDKGVTFVSQLMNTHGATRTDVLRAMFKVASQFPDRIAAVLAGQELTRPNGAPLLDEPAFDEQHGPSGLAGMRASARGKS